MRAHGQGKRSGASPPAPGSSTAPKGPQAAQVGMRFDRLSFDLWRNRHRFAKQLRGEADDRRPRFLYQLSEQSFSSNDVIERAQKILQPLEAIRDRANSLARRNRVQKFEHVPQLLCLDPQAVTLVRVQSPPCASCSRS